MKKTDVLIPEIKHDGFVIVLKGKILTVSKSGENREYTIPENNNGIEYKKGSEYFYIRTKNFYYQFKFEVNNSFVGDKFFNDNEYLESFASHTFGEN